MSTYTAARPTDPHSEAKMEGIDIPVQAVDAAKGLWSYLAVGLASLGIAVPVALGWWRKHVTEGTDTGARIQAIAELQAMLLAERDDRKAERDHFQRIEAALRQEIDTLRTRADQFAAERNDWMMKWSEVSGQLKAVQEELESLRRDMRLMNGGGNHAKPED